MYNKIILTIAAFLLSINFILGFLLVFLEKRNTTATLAWLLALFFLPGLGIILYLFLGRNLRGKKIFSTKINNPLEPKARQQKILLEAGKAISDNPLVHKYKDLVYLNLHTVQSPLLQTNKIKILSDGLEKFPALIESLERAKSHIHMEYFIIRDDNISRKVRDILAKKASEGVEIRLLYDGMGSIKLPKGYFRPIIQAGGQVAQFHPPFASIASTKINHRNHRKITVIDGTTAFTGGFNLGDEYLGLSPKFGYWRDTHLIIEGEAVDILQLCFMADWESSSKEPITHAAKYFPKKPDVGNTVLQVIADSPFSKWATIRQGYFKMITKAEKYIYIQTPYFIPDESLAEALKIAALGGVDVRLMIPCKPDHPFIYWATLSYASELLETGARIYSYTKGFLHSKTIIVDGQISSVGSANLDRRSFDKDFEVNTLIYEPQIAKKLEELFLEDIKNSQEITPAIYANRSAIVKLKESISRLLSPIL